jgi:hypothetical protein
VLPDDFHVVGWDHAWQSPDTAGPLIEDPLGAIEDWVSSNCKSEFCPGLFVTSERPLEVTEKEGKVVTKRSGPSGSWGGQATSPAKGEVRVPYSSMTWTVVCPPDALEILFEGGLSPKLTNGLGNGFSPSHEKLDATSGTLFNGSLGNLTFTGEWLITGWIDLELITAEP